VRRCAAGAAAHLIRRGRARAGVAVGYDGRFLSARFASEMAATLRTAGFAPQLSPEPIPTPALSLRVVDAGAALGLMVTASHNPPEYAGVKLKDAAGGTLDPVETEELARAIPDRDPGPAPGGPPEPAESFLPDYVAALRERVAIPRIRRLAGTVVADSMHGMGGRLLERILAPGGPRVVTLRPEPDPLFGGSNPEPIARHLRGMVRAVRAEGARIGIATDGDADRIAACDERGRFLSPLTLLPLLAVHLIEVRKERGGIARTFAGSIRVERIARRHGLPFHNLPVGFKHVAALLRRGEILLGGEESGGFGFRGFLPERDGLLSALLLLEALALSGEPLSELVRRMEREYGRTAYDRVDLPCPPEAARRAVARIAASPPRSVAGMRVTGIDPLDGVKLLFGGEGWLLLRGSGTEPVLRLYCEAPTATAVAAALRHAVRLARV
jgi:phosphomannomutase